MEDKLLYQQKSALVFTEVSIAVDIKVLEDVTTATFCGSWFSVSSASQGKKTQIKNPYSTPVRNMRGRRSVTHRWSFNRRIFVKM